MSRVVRWIGGGAIAWAALACGGGGTSSATAAAESDPSVARVCSTACESRDRCAHTQEAERCTPACRANRRIQKLRFARADVIDRTVECLASPDCEPSEDGSTRGQRCVARVLRETQPSDKVTAVCKRLDDFTARCGGNPMRACVERLKVLREEFVDRVLACTDEPCRAAGRCLIAVSERISD